MVCYAVVVNRLSPRILSNVLVFVAGTTLHINVLINETYVTSVYNMTTGLQALAGGRAGGQGVEAAGLCCCC